MYKGSQGRNRPTSTVAPTAAAFEANAATETADLGSGRPEKAPAQYTSEVKIPWKAGSLLYGSLGTAQPKYWRVVATGNLDSDTNTSNPSVEGRRVVLLHVEPGKTPHTSRLPSTFPFDYVEPRLAIVADSVRLAFMNKPDAEQPPHSIARRDARCGKIEELLKPAKLLEVLRRDSRVAALSEHSRKTGVAVPMLRKLLTRYWWYGCDEAALLDLTPLKGGAGKTRLTPTVHKRGRRNAVAKEDPSHMERGANYDERHREKFVEALIVFWAGEGLSLSKTWEKMKDVLYATPVTRQDGTTYKRKTPLRKIPTKGIFYYHAHRLIAELGLTHANLGSLDFASNAAAQPGKARDIADGPGDIFDIDATEFNFELVASFDTSLRLGRPTVYIVVDRHSSAILGFHVECRAERWEGYRLALYCAFTPKDALLDRLGLLGEVGNIFNMHAVPSAIFSDRGPARSNSALDTLCRELKLEKAAPPPKSPTRNPVVESLQKKMQKMLAALSGGYERNSDQRSKDRRSKARKTAIVTEEKFLKLLVAAAHDHNISAEVPDALLPWMNKVDPVPQAIFLAGIKRSTIDHHRHRDYAELYARLLPTKELSVSAKGVRSDNAWYYSDDLYRWWRHQRRVRGKNPRTRVSFDAAPQTAYWRPEPTVWAELPMTKENQVRHKGMSWDDYERYYDERNKKLIHTRGKAHRKKILARVSEGVIREAAAQSVAVRPSALSNQSVRNNRRIAEVKREHHQSEATKGLLKGMKAQGPVPNTERPVPAKKAARPASGTPLSELRRRTFAR